MIYNSLESLPIEIQISLSSYLSVKDIIAVSQVSATLRKIHKGQTFRKCIVVHGVSPSHPSFDSFYLATEPRCRIVSFAMVQNPEKYASWFSPALVKTLLIPIELTSNAVQKASNRLFEKFRHLDQVFYFASKKPENSVNLGRAGTAATSSATRQKPIAQDDSSTQFYGFGVVDHNGNLVFCDDSLAQTKNSGCCVNLGHAPESVRLSLMVDNIRDLSAFSSLTFISSLNIHFNEKSPNSRFTPRPDTPPEISALNYDFSQCANLRRFALNGLPKDPGNSFYEKLYDQLSTLPKLEHVSVTHFMSRIGTFCLTEKLEKGPQKIKTCFITLRPPVETRVLLEKMVQSHNSSLQPKTLSHITHLAIKVPSQYGALGVRWIFDIYHFPRLVSTEINISQSQSVVQYVEATNALVNKYYHACRFDSNQERPDDEMHDFDGSKDLSQGLDDRPSCFSTASLYSPRPINLIDSNHDFNSPLLDSASSNVSAQSFGRSTQTYFPVSTPTAKQKRARIPPLNIKDRCRKTLDKFGVQSSFSNVITASEKILHDICNVESLTCLPSFFSSCFSFSSQPMFSNIKTLVLDSFELLVTENKPAFESPFFSQSKSYDKTIAIFFGALYEFNELLEEVYSFISLVTNMFDFCEVQLTRMLDNIKNMFISKVPGSKTWNIPLERLLGLLLPSCFSVPSSHPLLKNEEFAEKIEGYGQPQNPYFAYYVPYSSKDKDQPLYTGMLYAYKYMANTYEAVLRLLPNLEHLEIRNAYNATPLPQLGYLIHMHSQLKSVLITQYVNCFAPEWKTPFEAYMYPVVLPGSPRTSAFIDVEGSRSRYHKRLVADKALRYDGLKENDDPVKNEIHQRRINSDPWNQAGPVSHYAEKFTYGVSCC